MAGEVFIARQDTLESVKSNSETILSKLKWISSDAVIRDYVAGEDLKIGNVVELINNKVIKSKQRIYKYDSALKCDYNSQFFKIDGNKVLKINKVNAQILAIDKAKILLQNKIDFSGVSDCQGVLAEQINNTSFLLLFYTSNKVLLQILNIIEDKILLNAMVQDDIKGRFKMKKLDNNRILLLRYEDNNNTFAKIININNNVISLGKEILLRANSSSDYIISILDNSRVLIYLFDCLVVISIDGSNITIGKKFTVTTMWNRHMVKIADNKYLIYGNADTDSRGFAQILNITGTDIVFGNVNNFSYSNGYQPTAIPFDEEKVLMISSNRLENGYTQILNINNLNIINGPETKFTDSIFYHIAKSIDGNRIIYVGANRGLGGSVCILNVCVGGEKVSVSNNVTCNNGSCYQSADFIIMDDNRILAFGYDSNQNQFMEVMIMTNDYFANLVTINNRVLGVVLNDAKINNDVTVAIKGIIKLDGFSFNNASELNNINGSLKTSYVNNLTPYAISIDVDTIEILKPYSKENTI